MVGSVIAPPVNYMQECAKLTEKLARYKTKNKELKLLLEQQATKLDLELKKSNALLAESKKLK
jgi:hypothetical protein